MSEDKHELLGDFLEDHDFTADDICKVLCALTKRMMDEANTNTADIETVICGSGYKFTINMKAEKAGLPNGI
jgi:hypothetical protein